MESKNPDETLEDALYTEPYKPTFPRLHAAKEKIKEKFLHAVDNIKEDMYNIKDWEGGWLYASSGLGLMAGGMFVSLANITEEWAVPLFYSSLVGGPVLMGVGVHKGALSSGSPESEAEWSAVKKRAKYFWNPGEVLLTAGLLHGATTAPFPENGLYAVSAFWIGMLTAIGIGESISHRSESYKDYVRRMKSEREAQKQREAQAQYEARRRESAPSIRDTTPEYFDDDGSFALRGAEADYIRHLEWQRAVSLSNEHRRRVHAALHHHRGRR